MYRASGTTNMIIGNGATVNVGSTTFGSNFSGTLSLGASNGNLRFTTGSTAFSTLGKFDLGTGSVLMNNRDGTLSHGSGLRCSAGPTRRLPDRLVSAA